MNILLVGATGQIGWALTHALHQAGHALTVLVRRAGALPMPGGTRVLEAAVFDDAAFAKALQGIDAVIYGVGLPEQFAFDDGVFARTNRDLFAVFLQSLEHSPVRRLVYISTYEVFEAQGGRIVETHAPADTAAMTPYFRAMGQAYRLALDAQQRLGLALTTIHPAAVYGGLNTGDGFTNYLENLLQWRVWRMPAIVRGEFPVVHAESLAQAIVKALDHRGAFIVSDGMSSLRGLALALRAQTSCWVPPRIPLFMARASAALFEAFARLSGRRPILARVQLDFITQGWQPVAERARQELGWQPLPLEDGLARYLRTRAQLPPRGSPAPARDRPAV
jgi:dihydroflavonol-4-reductase